MYAQYEEEAAKRDMVGAQPQEEVIADDDVVAYILLCISIKSKFQHSNQ